MKHFKPDNILHQHRSREKGRKKFDGGWRNNDQHKRNLTPFANKIKIKTRWEEKQEKSKKRKLSSRNDGGSAVHFHHSTVALRQEKHRSCTDTGIYGHHSPQVNENTLTVNCGKASGNHFHYRGQHVTWVCAFTRWVTWGQVSADVPMPVLGNSRVISHFLWPNL